VRRPASWREPCYLLAHLAGAILACLFVLAMFGLVSHLGATPPGPMPPAGRHC
jgi:hypothetical protein